MKFQSKQRLNNEAAFAFIKSLPGILTEKGGVYLSQLLVDMDYQGEINFDYDCNDNDYVATLGNRDGQGAKYQVNLSIAKSTISAVERCNDSNDHRINDKKIYQYQQTS